MTMLGTLWEGLSSNSFEKIPPVVAATNSSEVYVDGRAAPIRLARRSVEAMPARPLRVGDAVDALWPEDDEWYRAEIVKIDAATGRLSLQYEDGDFRDDGLPEEVELVGAAEDDAPPRQDDVEAAAGAPPVAGIAHAEEDDDGLGDILDGILDAPTPSGAVVPPKPFAATALASAVDDGLGAVLDGVLDGSPRPAAPAAAPEAAAGDDDDDDDDDYGDDDYEDAFEEEPETPLKEAPPPEAPAEMPVAAAPAAALKIDDDFGDMLDGILDDDDDDDGGGGGGGADGGAATKLQARIRGRKGRRTVLEKRQAKAQSHGAATALQARIRGRKGRRTVLEKREGFKARKAPKSPENIPRLLPDEPAPPQLPPPLDAAPQRSAAAAASAAAAPRSSGDDGDDGVFALTALGGAENESPVAPAWLDPLDPSTVTVEPGRGGRLATKKKRRPLSASSGGLRATTNRPTAPKRPASASAARRQPNAPPPPSATDLVPRPPALPDRCWEGVKRWLDLEIALQAIEPRPASPTASQQQQQQQQAYPPPAHRRRRRPAKRPDPGVPPRPVNQRRSSRDIKLLERGFDLRLTRH